MRKITFDIETKNIFSDVDSNDPADLDISIVCIHDSETDQYHSYDESELPHLWPILEQSDMLIGFNSDHFDVPLLNKYYPGDLTQIKSLDLLKEVKASAGRRMKLDQIAEGSLGEKKTGHGLEAITWWKNGEIDKIRQYCTDDVRITKQVYDYAIEHGKLKYAEGGQVHEIPLDTSHWEQKQETAMTHTLPF